MWKNWKIEPHSIAARIVKTPGKVDNRRIFKTCEEAQVALYKRLKKLAKDYARETKRWKRLSKSR